MRTRTLRLLVLATSLVWIGCATAYLLPGVREEFEEKAFIRRVAELQTPVIPLPCFQTRGTENEDFIREDQNSAKCWVDLSSFHRLYPEIAAATDVAATIRLNAEDELPTEQRERALLRAVATVASLPVLLLLVELLWGWRASISRWPRASQRFLLRPTPTPIYERFEFGAQDVRSN